MISRFHSFQSVSFSIFQLQDILKFGVDKILNDETEEDDVDFTEILGPTVKGQWQINENGKDKKTDKETDKMEEEDEVIKYFFYFI